jgi:hypothetical protein
VVKQLAQASLDIWNVGNTAQLKHMYDELDSMSEVGMGTFDPEADIAQIDIPRLAEHVQKASPELWHLLGCLMALKDYRSNRDAFTKYQGAILMICAILVYCRALRAANNL